MSSNQCINKGYHLLLEVVFLSFRVAFIQNWSHQFLRKTFSHFIFMEMRQSVRMPEVVVVPAKILPQCHQKIQGKVGVSNCSGVGPSQFQEIFIVNYSMATCTSEHCWWMASAFPMPTAHSTSLLGTEKCWVCRFHILIHPMSIMPHCWSWGRTLNATDVSRLVNVDCLALLWRWECAHNASDHIPFKAWKCAA